MGSSLSWSYDSWIDNYLCNQCLSPPKLWVQTLFDTTLCDKVFQWLATGRWFSPGTPVSSISKTDQRDITEILLKMALNTRNQTYLHKYINMVTYWYMTGNPQLHYHDIGNNRKTSDPVNYKNTSAENSFLIIMDKHMYYSINIINGQNNVQKITC